MKWTLLITAACLVGGSASTEDASPTSTALTLIVDRALEQDEPWENDTTALTTTNDPEAYEPWELYTPVYTEFEDGWYTGKITGFDSETGEYEILWSDDELLSYDDYDVVDEMVDNFSTEVRDYDDNNCDDAWPDETDIYVFEDDRGWWGKITQCQRGVYTTTWENGDVGYYNESEDFDKMVTDAQDLSNNEDAEDNYDGEAASHDFTEQTYDVGTVVYKEFDDGWYKGKVLSFQNDMYNVMWSDGEDIDYPEGEEMDQMVADAVDVVGTEDGAELPTPYDEDYEPWENGTPVYYEFEDGWYDGKITGFDTESRKYEVLWSDDEVLSYDDFSLVDEMVDNYSIMVRDHKDSNCEYAWPDDTDIWVFEDDRGWWGKVTQCQDGVYTTTWENGDVGYYDEGPDFDKMVTDAKELSSNEDPEDNFDSESASHDFTEQTYDEGTIVYKEFEDKWYEGEVISFQDDTYTVRFSDGEEIEYPEGDEMDQMVADAVNVLGKEKEAGALPTGVHISLDDAKKGGGLIFALLACIGVVAFCIIRRNRKKRKLAAAKTLKSDAVYRDDDIGGYRDDDPQSEPTIMMTNREIS